MPWLDIGEAENCRENGLFITLLRRRNQLTHGFAVGSDNDSLPLLDFTEVGRKVCLQLSYGNQCWIVCSHNM